MRMKLSAGNAYWQGALGPELAGLSPGLQKMLRYGANLSPDKRLRSQQAIASSLAMQPRIGLVPRHRPRAEQECLNTVAVAR